MGKELLLSQSKHKVVRFLNVQRNKPVGFLALSQDQYLNAIGSYVKEQHLADRLALDKWF